MRYEVPLIRLYVLRATYLVIAVGLGIQIWPLIVQSASTPPAHMQGVVRAVLATVALLAVLGIRYPLRLLPLLLFELLWKSVWLLAIGLPLWRSGRLDAATGDTWTTCLGSVLVIMLVIPWGHVMRYYVRAPGDRWRDGTTAGGLTATGSVTSPAP